MPSELDTSEMISYDKAEAIYDRIRQALQIAVPTITEDQIERACLELDPIVFDLIALGYSDGAKDEAQFRDWCEAEAAKAGKDIPDYPDPVGVCPPLTIKP